MGSKDNTPKRARLAEQATEKTLERGKRGVAGSRRPRTAGGQSTQGSVAGVRSVGFCVVGFFLR